MLSFFGVCYAKFGLKKYCKQFNATRTEIKVEYH